MRRVRRLLLDVAPLRLDREYRYLWTGQLLSAGGREITRVALPFQVYLLTRSPLAIGLIAVVELVPLVGLSLIGGVIADSVERRRLMIVAQVALAATSGAFTLLALSPDPPI